MEGRDSLSLNQIDADHFIQMVQAASLKLNQNAKFINSLNVFPVPDGDTGTNMSMSMASGLKYVKASDSESVGDLAAALAKGLLMGARGNSGVITSQIFRGFSKSVAGKKTLNAKDITEAFKYSAKVAYKAVMKPTEGTILTVIRIAAQGGIDALSDEGDLKAVMDNIYVNSQKALKKTPDLLPVLKKVGVVDSGGQGLVMILGAFDDIINGKKVAKAKKDLTPAEMAEVIKVQHHKSVQSKLDPSQIKYQYCTQMTVRFGRGKLCDRKFNYDEFYNYLAKLGDSLLVVNDNEVVKVHVHSNHPAKVLAWGQHFGDLTKVKVDNMVKQQEDIIGEDEKPKAESKPETPQSTIVADQEPKNKKTAVISVVAGKGLGVLFKSLGVTDIVSGGQTMNPSTNDILKVINNCHAKQAIVLPNNGNIYMAAKAAADHAKIPTAIVKTKTVNQGMAVMLGFNPDASLKENQAEMASNLDEVKSGQVTYAIRDSDIGGVKVKKGDFMGIVDGKIKVTDPDVGQAALKMVKAMLDDDSEVITIIYGQDSNEKAAKALEAKVQKLDSDLETEVHEGDQPVYPFIISVE